MMKNFLLFRNLSKCSGLFVAIFPLIAVAQNLVLNPSFENTSACPQGISEFNRALNWDAANSGNDTCSTPDLYAACASTLGGVNVPNGLMGYQYSHSGTHHAGAIPFSGFTLLGGCNNIAFTPWREYLQGQLSQPLLAGTKYCVKMYMSLAEQSVWATDDMGIYLSATHVQRDFCAHQNDPWLPYTPQLTLCNGAVTDTGNWVELKWSYVASGGEQYFVIGNFKSDANTTLINANCTAIQPYIYYFFDDISIEQGCCADSLVFSNIIQPGCGVSGSATAKAFSVTCGANPYSYNWSNGTSGQSISNVSAGTYTVTVSSGGGCSSTGSLNLNIVTALTLQKSSTNPACGNNNGSATITVSSGSGPYTYVWSNGGNTATINNLTAGIYTVTVTGAAGCTASTSVELLGASGLTLSPSVTDASCGASNGGATVNVTGGSPPYTYSWSNGQTSATLNNLAPGNYSVTVQSDTTGSVFYTEDFTNNGAGWTMNVNSGTNGTGANRWIVNNDNNCTCGTGKYLHITCDSASFFCLFMQGQCFYFPGPAIPTDPTTDKYASSPDISTLGKINITLRFNYLCDGLAGSDYGQVRLSNNGGTSWTDLPTQYQGVTTCTQASVSVPAAYENITNFRIAFRWKNGSSGNGNDPGFTVDDVRLSSAASSCPAITTVTVGSSGLTLAVNTTQTTCGQNNGFASVNVIAGSGPFTYSWNNGSSAQTINNLGAGVYSVTVVGSGGCSASVSTSIVINNGLTLSASSVNTSCGNSNGSASVSVLPTGTYTYLWSTGATTSSIANVAAGTYTVTVNGTNGCSASASVIVNPSGNNPVTVVADYPVICSGDSDRICAPAGYNAYHWNTGETTQCIFAKLAGNYYVTVTDAGNCTATSNHLPVNVYPLPPVSISVNGDTLTAYNAVTYQWILNGVAIPGATSNIYIALQSGSYSVQVTDSNSCRAISTDVMVTTGITDLSADEKFLVYPNPLETGSWNLEAGSGLIGKNVEIFDNSGRLIYKCEIRNRKSQIESDFPKGVYLLRIVTANRSMTRKLIKL